MPGAAVTSPLIKPDGLMERAVGKPVADQTYGARPPGAIACADTEVYCLAVMRIGETVIP